MRRLLIVAVAATALLAAMAPPVDATPPSEFTMEGANPEDGSDGTFTAFGDAVVNGTMCGEGTTAYELFEYNGPFPPKNPKGINFNIRKRFTCEDESGTFLLKAQGRAVFGEGVTFNWVILSGTGDYEDLHGTGSGTAAPGETGVADDFVGKLHQN